MQAKTTVGIDAYHLKMVRLIAAVAGKSVPVILSELIDYSYGPLCDRYAKNETISQDAADHVQILSKLISDKDPTQ
jgi:hypothetical protein